MYLSCIRTEEVKRAREREHFYQRDSVYPAFNRQRIVTRGRNGTPGVPIPNPSGAEAIVYVLIAYPLGV